MPWNPSIRDLTASSQEPQQHSRLDVIIPEPAAEGRQIEPVSAYRPQRIIPVRQMGQILDHQPENAPRPCQTAPGSRCVATKFGLVSHSGGGAWHH